MMIRISALSIPLLLVACTIAPPENLPQATSQAGARPVSAILYKQALNVVYDDKALCAATRPVAKSIWGSALSGCPHLHGFTIEERVPLNAARLPLQPGEGSPQARISLSVVIDDGSIVKFHAP